MYQIVQARYRADRRHKPQSKMIVRVKRDEKFDCDTFRFYVKACFTIIAALCLVLVIPLIG